jgi:hypothetical protein
MVNLGMVNMAAELQGWRSSFPPIRELGTSRVNREINEEHADRGFDFGADTALDRDRFNARFFTTY